MMIKMSKHLSHHKSKFVKEEAIPAKTETAPAEKTPGFGLFFALGALLVAVMARRR